MHIKEKQFEVHEKRPWGKTSKSGKYTWKKPRRRPRAVRSRRRQTTRNSDCKPKAASTSSRTRRPGTTAEHLRAKTETIMACEKRRQLRGFISWRSRTLARRGDCLKVVQWGDDEEGHGKIACMACIQAMSVEPSSRDRDERSERADVYMFSLGCSVTFFPRVRIHYVAPHSEIYGCHPRDFVFGRNGEMIRVSANSNSGTFRLSGVQAVVGGVRMQRALTLIDCAGRKEGSRRARAE